MPLFNWDDIRGTVMSRAGDRAIRRLRKALEGMPKVPRMIWDEADREYWDGAQLTMCQTCLPLAVVCERLLAYYDHDNP